MGQLTRLGAAVLLVTLLLPQSAQGQSIVTGELEGMVTDPSGRPIPGALITLRAVGADGGRVETATGDGRFSFSSVLPGRYDLLAEALGRRPVVVDPLRIRAGRAATLRLVLVTSVPPVERRDTLQHAGLPDAAGGGLAWLDGQAVRTLPSATPELASLVSLAGPVDPAGGMEGLPERLTVFYVDGQPFQPARHPHSGSDQAGGMVIPRSALAAASVPRTSDVEWGGGQVVALSTGVQRDGPPELFGMWGGDVGWSGNSLPGGSAAFASWWGGAATTLALVPDTAFVHLTLESGRWHRPLAPLVSDSLALTLGQAAGGLHLPALGQSTWTNGSLRLGWALSEEGALQATLGGATFSHDLPGWPHPDLRYLASPPKLEGTDVFGGASLALPLSSLFGLEIRAGGSLSRRRFGAGEDTPSFATLLSDPPVTLAGPVQERGEVSRSDVSGSGVIHLTSGPHRAKVGIRANFASLKYDLLDRSRGVFLFGNGRDLGDQGLFFESVAAVPPISFVVPTGEAFAQYRWSASPGVTLTVGGHYGRTYLPTDLIRLDDRWQELSGLANDQVPDRADYGGGLVHGSWDPTGGSRTVLEGGLSMDYGEIDPAALYEVIQNNGLFSVRRVSGDLSTWPAPPPGDTGTRASALTLLDPELSPPETSRALIAFAHRFGDGTVLRVEGSIRRTELLLRRSDLNTPIVPALLGEGERPVQSPVGSWGGVVGPLDAGWRRFAEYDAVWALNADGWSRYRGLSVGLDRAFGRGGLIFANYSYSETTDNLVGLAAGDPWARLPAGIPGIGATPWEEGPSDLDVPHRATAGLILPIPGSFLGLVSAVYRTRSGAPFTPMVRTGLDVNGDGSWVNDVAWVPGSEEARRLAEGGGCVDLSSGAFPTRNSCRGPALHELDLRLTLGPLALGRAELELTVDLVNATDQEEGIRDDALLLLDPSVPLSVNAGTLSVPYRRNPGFGSLAARSDRGRQLRIGFRLGAAR